MRLRQIFRLKDEYFQYLFKFFDVKSIDLKLTKLRNYFSEENKLPLNTTDSQSVRNLRVVNPNTISIIRSRTPREAKPHWLNHERLSREGPDHSTALIYVNDLSCAGLDLLRDTTQDIQTYTEKWSNFGSYLDVSTQNLYTYCLKVCKSQYIFVQHSSTISVFWFGLARWIFNFTSFACHF